MEFYLFIYFIPLHFMIRVLLIFWIISLKNLTELDPFLIYFFLIIFYYYFMELS